MHDTVNFSFSTVPLTIQPFFFELVNIIFVLFLISHINHIKLLFSNFQPVLPIILFNTFSYFFCFHKILVGSCINFSVNSSALRHCCAENTNLTLFRNKLKYFVYLILKTLESISSASSIIKHFKPFLKHNASSCHKFFRSTYNKLCTFICSLKLSSTVPITMFLSIYKTYLVTIIKIYLLCKFSIRTYNNN